MHRASRSQALPSVLASIKHGSHSCAFYETDDDLIDLVIPFLSSRADRDELCVWMMPDSVCDAERTRAAERGIEPYRARDLYLEGPHFEYGPVTKFWNEKLHEAVSCGFRNVCFRRRLLASAARLEDLSRLRSRSKQPDRRQARYAALHLSAFRQQSRRPPGCSPRALGRTLEAE